MTNYKISRTILVSAFFLFYTFLLVANTNNRSLQNDTLVIYRIQNIPEINGNGNDACWTNIQWHPIDQVWIPYGESIPSTDFNGRFKVVYSSETNLLYFLVEIIDDMGVDGYSPDGGTADIYNFDILEVFLDENKSGGPHMMDDPGSDQNAENAFAYHIYAAFPYESSITKSIYVGDMPGENWADHLYSSHFPEFALARSDNSFTREFSLKVYNDTYIGTNQEDSRVILTGGKLMGLSLAYCDNDDPNEEPKVRDSFFGSVQVTAEAFNDHWWNADDFGPAVLGEINEQTGIDDPLNQDKISPLIFPNPVLNTFNILFEDEYTGMVVINIINSLAQIEKCYKMEKHSKYLTQNIDLKGLGSGLYSIQILYNDRQTQSKILVTN